ncbi:MAG TPA: SRPBCC family protein [Candidatus Acidoferrum sp.]
MFLRIVLVIVVLIAAILIFAANKPNTFRIQRSILIQAPPDKVFVLIDILHNWSRWAPQDREDRAHNRTFSGAPSGTGAISNWGGKGSSGKGRMLISESAPPSKITIQVDFEKPFAAHNINEFVLEPAGEQTNVTWTMHGPNLFIMKLMSVFANMDKAMGKHFEDGLQNLKAVAEQ